MTQVPIDVPDPRSFPDPAQAPAGAAALYARAEAALGAETALGADEIDAELRAALAAGLGSNATALAAALAGAPSVAVARHLWRLLDEATRHPPGVAPDAAAASLFAVPVIVVAGVAGKGTPSLPGTLPAPERLAAILRDGGALGGNRNFALADALVGTDALAVARLPELLSWRALPASAAPAAPPGPRSQPVLPPQPILLTPDVETVSLRFVVGTALARAGADLVADASVGKWGIPLAQELGRQLSADGVTVLALPRAPQRLLPAVQQGRAAQREVSAAVFVGNALRTLRAAAGEPAAVISAHVAPGVPGGGELRLSLSSPFEPRDAEGFRCPLHPLDRVTDVARMLVELLRDCRVADVRVLGGVHPDRDPATGLRLLFKPATLPANAAVLLH